MRKLIAGGLTGALGMLLFASTALAASHNPTGEYTPFAECPLNRATINDCVYSVTGGGSFTMGSKTVPVKNPVILQGGFEGENAGIEFYGAENGDTLSKTPQPVPGGLVGVTAPTWWPKFLQNRRRRHGRTDRSEQRPDQHQTEHGKPADRKWNGARPAGQIPPRKPDPRR